MSSYIGSSERHYTTVDGKQFAHDGTYQGKAKAYARAESHDMHRRAAIEKRLGRTLSDDEYFAGQVKHFEDRDQLAKERDDKFKPIGKEPGRYDGMKADIQRRIQEREVDKMSSLERQLWDIERLEQQDAEKIAEQNAKESHLKNPRVKAALKELNAVLDDIKWDESRTAGEFASVQNAIRQWETYDADTAVAESMLRSILDREDSRTEAINAAKREQIASLQSSITPGRGAVTKVEINRQQALKDQGHDLYSALSEANAGFNHLDRVYEANRALEAGDSSQLEALIDTYAVSDNQTLA
jgi:sugar-specific transcriptional regulator TrmB